MVVAMVAAAATDFSGGEQRQPVNLNLHHSAQYFQNFPSLGN